MSGNDGNGTSTDDGNGDGFENVGLAFGLVSFSGLSTTIGAALVFCKRFVQLANHRTLAAGLGFSSGVMLYISFVEILDTSVEEFEACGCLWGDKDDQATAAYIAGTMCFFFGVIVTYLLDMCVHSLTGNKHAPNCPANMSANLLGRDIALEGETQTRTGPCRTQHGNRRHQPHHHRHHHHPHASGSVFDEDADADVDAEADADADTTSNVLDEPKNNELVRHEDSYDNPEAIKDSIHISEPAAVSAAVDPADGDENADVDVENPSAKSSNQVEVVQNPEEAKKLNDTGMLVALAIAIHNFPEGLATFAATLTSPSAGIALSLAIAIHNIPEGMCISVPIYYATGNRWRGFWLSFFSGLTEIVGALLGYGFLLAFFSPAAFGVMYGFVGGMMVAIVLKEMLPTGHRYDTHIVTPFTFIGMLVMAVSLILFEL